MEGKVNHLSLWIPIRTVEESSDVSKWRCLATKNCDTEIKITKNTSNATNNLGKIHGIFGSFNEVEKKEIEVKTRNVSERNAILQINPVRYHEINMAKIFVAKLLPFTFPECAEVRTFAGMLHLEGHYKNDLRRHRMKKTILEMYAATASKLVAEIAVVYRLLRICRRQ